MKSQSWMIVLLSVTSGWIGSWSWGFSTENEKCVLGSTTILERPSLTKIACQIECAKKATSSEDCIYSNAQGFQTKFFIAKYKCNVSEITLPDAHKVGDENDGLAKPVNVDVHYSGKLHGYGPGADYSTILNAEGKTLTEVRKSCESHCSSKSSISKTQPLAQKCQLEITESSKHVRSGNPVYIFQHVLVTTPFKLKMDASNSLSQVLDKGELQKTWVTKVVRDNCPSLGAGASKAFSSFLFAAPNSQCKDRFQGPVFSPLCTLGRLSWNKFDRKKTMSEVTAECADLCNTALATPAKALEFFKSLDFGAVIQCQIRELDDAPASTIRSYSLVLDAK